MILIYFKNMIRGRQRFGTIVLALAIAATLLIGASGLPHMGMTMTMDEHGNMTMSDCLMPGITAVCNMTPLQTLHHGKVCLRAFCMNRGPSYY